MLKKCLALLLLVTMSSACAQVIDLPFDATPGLPFNAANYTSDTHYEDPSITADVYTGGRIHDTNYIYAVIKIASPTQIRTAMAYKYKSSYTRSGASMSKTNNAVLAINGDYYSYRTTGYIVRQAVEYRTRPDEAWDVLMIDQHGDFHVITEPTWDKVEAWKAGHPDLQVINTFNFGPAFVADGQWLMEDFSAAKNYRKIAGYRGCARMAICQLAPLTYLVVACEGEMDKGSTGMDPNQFADCLKEVDEKLTEYDIQVAYNLDGGRSTTLVFNHEKLNSKSEEASRDLADIIYFASAWQAE